MRIAFAVLVQLFSSQLALAIETSADLQNLATFPISLDAANAALGTPATEEPIDTEVLPLEKGKVKTLKPDSKGRIPAGNCCTPISRQSEAVPFTAASAQSFLDAYNQVLQALEHFVYSEIVSKFSNYSGSLCPRQIFRIRGSSAGFTLTRLVNHYKLGSVENYEAGPFDPTHAAAIFKGTVSQFEKMLEIIDYSVEIMKVTNHPDLEEYERNQEIMHRNVNNFYQKVMKPHRYAYQVFSRVPLSEGTIQTLSNNMMEKLVDFKDEALALNSLGLEFFPEQQIIKIAVNIRQFPKETLTSFQSGTKYNKAQLRLLSISRDARRAIVGYNREITQRELKSNQAVMERYEAASMALYRANESKSVNCHAIWAFHRRNIWSEDFDRLILRSTNLQNLPNTDSSELKAFIALLKAGEDKIAFNHIEAQRKQLKDYIDIVFRMTREQIAQDWEDHKNGKEVSSSAGFFFRYYYSTMENWRYALKNVAF